ncbi:MAG: acetylxylan esterase [Chloroflexi bacterium]|nr:acetylxylan esterase [Chloroflexota bacterium]
MENADQAVLAATSVSWPPAPPADLRCQATLHTDTVFEPPAFQSLEEWEHRKVVLRQQVLIASGLWPVPERPPVSASFGRVHVFDGYSLQSVAFETRAGLWVTGNLYRPVAGRGLRPAILNPHGHWPDGRLEQSDRCNAPARCIQFARHGYIAFAWDMIGYGDNLGLPHRIGGGGDWLWGFHTFGLQLWNGLRTLDFIAGLPDVDPQRIGCVGESGGATQTLFLSAIDERIGYVAPVVMVSSHFQGGCVCENAPGLRIGTQNLEIAMMSAPRPMLVVSATGDWTANTPRVELPALQTLYGLYGAADRVHHHQVDAPHNFNQESREAVYTFFSHYFRGTAAGQWVREEVLDVPSGEQLTVFPSRRPPVVGADTLLRETHKKHWREVVAQHWPRSTAELLDFSDIVQPALRLALGQPPTEWSQLHIVSRGDVDFAQRRGTKLMLHHSDGSAVPALYVVPTPTSVGPNEAPVVLLSEAGKSAFFTSRDGIPALGPLVARLLARGHAVMLPDLFLTGEFERAFARLGRGNPSPHLLAFNPSDDALRVRDILLCAAATSKLTGSLTPRLVATGWSTPWAIAALPLLGEHSSLDAAWPVDGAISEKQMLEHCALPDILRIGGIETLLALAAPRRVRLYGKVPAPLLERVRAVYALHEQPQACTAIPGALSPDAPEQAGELV